MALGRDPDLRLAVGVGAREAGVRLDIALVHGRRLEAHLHDFVGRGEARGDVAHLVLDALRDVRGLRRRGLDAAGDHVLEEERRVGLHRLIDVDDVRQHLVVDLDQLQRLLGDGRGGRGDGGDGVALVEHLLARHDVARHVPEIHGDALGTDVVELLVGKVLGGHHRLHALQLLRLRRVDGADARVRVRRAQHLAPQHAGQGEIGAVLGGARHLRHAIGTHRARAYDLQLFFGLIDYACHVQVLRISLAASSTASMILLYPVQRHRLPASQ